MIKQLSATAKTILSTAALVLAVSATGHAQEKQTLSKSKEKPLQSAKPNEKPALSKTAAADGKPAPALAVINSKGEKQDKTQEGARTIASQMKAQLGLNDTQYAQVLDINKSFLQKANETKGTKLERSKKMKSLTDEREAKLKSVLTESQFKQYAASRAENMKRLKSFAASAE